MTCPYCDAECKAVAGTDGLFFCRGCQTYVEDENWDDNPPPKQFKTKVRPLHDNGS
jgi:transcription initiation factor TFIIIB Brf1 subunit/transcription initiation factor TFIIB